MAILKHDISKTQRQASGDHGRQAFGYGSDGQGNGDFEIVDGTLQPRPPVSRVRKVANVDGPDGHADDTNDL